ncbi:hypothetical protein A33M_3819 [Rhodovulum sp. PH10]|nr:hypothetical protein A33M_3819 [Rhodovulum sp. PH10]
MKQRSRHRAAHEGQEELITCGSLGRGRSVDIARRSHGARRHEVGWSFVTSR